MIALDKKKLRRGVPLTDADRIAIVNDSVRMLRKLYAAQADEIRDLQDDVFRSREAITGLLALWKRVSAELDEMRAEIKRRPVSSMDGRTVMQ